MKPPSKPSPNPKRTSSQSYLSSSTRPKRGGKKSNLKMVLWTVFTLMVLLPSCLVAGVYYYLNYVPLPLKAELVDVQIESGASPKRIANQLQAAGVEVSSSFIYEFFKWSGKHNQLKAGSYEINKGITATGLLNKLVKGEQAMRTVVLLEGWTFKQMQAALDKAPDLKHESSGMDQIILMRYLGEGESDRSAEGRFFPDTYHYPKNSSDLLIWKQALKAMDKQLALAWAERRPDLTLKSPYEALILASIIEKETGLASDRAQIAGVFHNRLRIGMRLQTDPSVIYGVENFDGNLRKIDLLTDTPYNTYTRSGLPPTPISMPGRAALRAATYPMPTDALYFVAKGDGSSHFSASLEEHNRAVNEYIRKKN